MVVLRRWLWHVTSHQQPSAAWGLLLQNLCLHIAQKALLGGRHCVPEAAACTTLGVLHCRASAESITGAGEEGGYRVSSCSHVVTDTRGQEL
jgi:hypothetical protein